MDPDDIAFRVPFKSVCPDHTDDYALKKFIEMSAVATSCDYCERGADEPIACSVHDLIEFIDQGIRHEWDHADDEGLPYETAEGGYQLATPLTNYELVDELEIASDAELAADITVGPDR